MIDLETLNKAIFLTQQGKIKEAESLYLNLLEKDSNDYMLLSAIGLFYVNIHDFDKASEYLEKACAINETLGTISALGFAEYEKGDYEKSAQILKKALNFGDSAEVYNKLILSLFRIKDYSQAVEFASIMHQKFPNNPNSISHMVKALTQTGKLLEAEKLCVGYLKENQNSASLWFHLGYLKELIYSDDRQACECYKMALDLGNLDAYYNIAVSYQKLGDFEKAEDYYNKMLEAYPNDVNTLTSLGMCKLKQKKFKEGYSLFYNRERNSIEKSLNTPWKKGDAFENEVLVFCEQGFGDHIQFIRYLPFLKEKVEKIYVASNEILIDLFKKNYPNIEFIKYNDINPNMQYIRITDLAYALDMDFDNIPFKNGYLKSEKSNIESNKLKVGLCWEAGSAGIRTMINRTININLLEPILNLENVQIYSFQVQDTLKGNERFPQMINLAKDFTNFNDTAKAMNSMDLIITVDTSVAHLAGALGIKTFLMLPYATDWRWFSDTKTTPWYNSIEIFKQADPISWEKPIEDIICKLKEYSS